MTTVTGGCHDWCGRLLSRDPTIPPNTMLSKTNGIIRSIVGVGPALAITIGKNRGKKQHLYSLLRIINSPNKIGAPDKYRHLSKRLPTVGGGLNNQILESR
jgi:hypothetical protein